MSATLPTTHAVPRGPDAEAVAIAPQGFTPAELVALAGHVDATVARLAGDALSVQHSLRVRLATLAGAPTHVREVEGGLLHVLGPAPKPVPMEVCGERNKGVPHA